MKRIISLFIGILMLVSALGVFTSCGKAPEFFEIEGRLRELIDASYEINDIFFGYGLPVYERVYETSKTIVDEKTETLFYYYEINDKELGRVIKYRSSWSDPFSYVQVVKEKDESRTLIFENGKVFAYALENYVEPHYDFYYSNNDPEDYDYITAECKYQSIGQIKAAAEKVYSKDYLESLYEYQFDGTVVKSGETLTSSTARYMEYEDEDGIVTLMMSNTYEPLVTEKRIYDFSTAKIVRPKRKDFVTISIDSYLESRPDERLNVKLTMILQDGVWMLDSGTY
jgi:hypothetical protein